MDRPLPGKISHPPTGTVPGQGDMLQRLRLASGLVLLTFATLHFLNHGLGVFSVGLMEDFQQWRLALWRSLPGTVVLYGAALIHVSLAVYKTARRRTLKMPAWEALQIVLGFAIPYYLIEHAFSTRGTHEMFGVDDTYTHELSILWRGLVPTQSLLLFLVWVHGMVGIHYWLRLRPWYPRLFPYLLAFAVVVPAFAMWGWIDAARRLWLLGQDEGFFTGEQSDWIDLMTWYGRAILIAIICGVGVLLVVHRVERRFRAPVAVTYPGDVVVRANTGGTLLEISRLNGVPHASVCGGRARCSTCRTKILSGMDTLPPPDAHEREVLAKVGADTDVRLACQIRPTDDLTVRPLLPAREARRSAARVADAYHWGVEQVVAILFVDIRSFTTMSERRLSYDVVYVLNRYLERMCAAIEGAGGYVDKFIGDGIMAIFGMATGPRIGCREALEAAFWMDQALREVNKELADSLDEPLAIGIGIHAGPAILGRIGAAGSAHIATNITALGDTVNAASRLESVTKDFGAKLVVSDAVIKAAGIDISRLEQNEVTVKGREKPLKVVVFRDITALQPLLDDDGGAHPIN